MGEQFGRRMGDWGVQFGKRANAWGLDVGKMASGSATQRRSTSGPAYYDQPPSDDLPPSYEPSASQETGVHHGDRKVDTHGYPEDRKVDTSAPAYPVEKGKSKSKDMGYDDDDASSISSDSSDSSSDSDTDDEEYEATFAARMRSINEQASAAAKEDKKSPEEVAQERAVATEKAQNEMQLKIASKLSKHAARRELKQRGRELKREHRQRKRELRATHDKKGKGRAKKSREWRDAKKEYRERRKELRKKKIAARKEWREIRSHNRKMREKGVSLAGAPKEEVEERVWLMIENLGP
jgi:hypothetical protein